MPSGPRQSSRNERTSRPRSPMSARTLTSASDPLAISPSSVLLPTPLPAKMPTRCPCPHVKRASMARCPVTNGWRMRARSSGGGVAALHRLLIAAVQRTAPVERPAQTVHDAAQQALAHRRDQTASQVRDAHAGMHVVGVLIRHQKRHAVLKADGLGQKRSRRRRCRWRTDRRRRPANCTTAADRWRCASTPLVWKSSCRAMSRRRRARSRSSMTRAPQ